MNQNEAPRGTVATLGHPANEILIIKTSHGWWRYVDSGKYVEEEAFRGGWEVYPAPEPERSWSPGDSCRLLGDYKVKHVEGCDEHPAGTVTDVRTGEVVERPEPEPGCKEA